MEKRQPSVEEIEKARKESFGDDDINPPRRKSSGLGEYLKYIVVGVVILTISIFAGNSMYAKSADITALKGQITSLQAGVKAAQDGLTTAVGGIPNQINTVVAASLSQVNAQINTDKATLASLSSQITGNINDIANLKANNSTITNLQLTIASLTKQLSADETTIKTLQDSITNLQNSVLALQPVTGTNTSGVSNVTIAIVGNPFTGSTSLVFAPITSSTASQSFSFTVTNNSGKTLNNVQFAIGLQLLDSTGNPITAGLPSGTTLSISSTGVIWNSQTTGYSYLLGFTNAAPTGIFGSMGAINIPTGTSTYSIIVTLTGTTTNSLSVYPIVKIVNSN